MRILILLLSSFISINSSAADTIIQRRGGEFIIVDQQTAQQIFSLNKVGMITIPAFSDQIQQPPPHSIKRVTTRKSKVIDSIFIRLERENAN